MEQLYSKAKNHKMTMSDGAVAYRLLNSAGFSESHKQVVRATVSEMTYDTMKKQLTKVFTNTCSSSSSNMERNVKLEPTDSYYTQCSEGADRHFTQNKSCDGTFCGYTNYNNYRGNYRGPQRGNTSFRGGRGARGRGRGATFKKENPKDNSGNVSKCFSCGSTSHWIRECPNRFNDKEESL